MASSMVFSPVVDLPRCLIPSMAASKAALISSAVSSSFPLEVIPAFMNAVPYNGPDAPPTVETNVMPTPFKMSSMFFSSNVGNFSSTAFMPRLMLIPWSPSPMAWSISVKAWRCSCILSLNRWIKVNTFSFVAAIINSFLRLKETQRHRAGGSVRFSPYPPCLCVIFNML